MRMNDSARDEITLIILTTEEGKLDQLLHILHTASDTGDYIDESD